MAAILEAASFGRRSLQRNHRSGGGLAAKWLAEQGVWRAIDQRDLGVACGDGVNAWEFPTREADTWIGAHAAIGSQRETGADARSGPF